VVSWCDGVEDGCLVDDGKSVGSRVGLCVTTIVGICVCGGVLGSFVTITAVLVGDIVGVSVEITPTI